MKKDALRGAEKYTKEHQRKKRWYRVVTCLACVVVFCTVYALILPAITLEKGACEIPEHTHSEACYTQVTSTRTEPVCTIESLNLHQHDDTCYDSEGNLTCGYADYVVHRHDSSCYDEDGNLWCPLPEIETHEHTDSCYSVPETDASAEVHTHTDDCYTMERGELICTEPAHEHTDDCYEWKKVLTCDLSTEPAESTLEESTEPVLICEKPEVILHTHQPYESPENPGCYDEDGNLVCGQIQVLEHQHTEDCFTTVEEPVDADTLTCTNTDENHTHTALCYGRWELTCGMEEHTHTEDCGGDSEAVEETQETQEALEQTFYCGKTSHVHTEDCGGEGVCPLEEHIHTDNCKIPPEEEALAELSFEGPDYTVTVQYGADAALPEGV
ncbi:MAG: hypothetical protein PUF14_05865, partial [Clostridiales bacterium]|nr:hypothetical protein [Clostridiales bacterium]